MSRSSTSTTRCSWTRSTTIFKSCLFMKRERKNTKSINAQSKSSSYKKSRTDCGAKTLLWRTSITKSARKLNLVYRNRRRRRRDQNRLLANSNVLGTSLVSTSKQWRINCWGLWSMMIHWRRSKMIQCLSANPRMNWTTINKITRCKLWVST